MLPVIAFAADPVTVSNPWFRYIVPNVPAGGYMTLQNQSSSPAVLIGAASPACGMIMVHRSESKSGTETMEGAPTVTVPAGGTRSFAPGGYHLMCMQPNMKPGEQVPVTLTFQDGHTVSATFPVFSVNQQPNAQ
jgi:copper(I)-binding protein